MLSTPFIPHSWGNLYLGGTPKIPWQERNLLHLSITLVKLPIIPMKTGIHS